MKVFDVNIPRAVAGLENKNIINEREDVNLQNFSGYLKRLSAKVKERIWYEFHQNMTNVNRYEITDLFVYVAAMYCQEHCQRLAWALQ